MLAGGSAAVYGDSSGGASPTARRMASAIDSGGFSTCVVTTAASVKCWGYNVDGQLGVGSNLSLGNSDGELGANLPAVELGTGRTARAVSVGGSHACALLDDASVKCWGDNANFQLGIVGGDRTRGDAPGEMGDALDRVPLGERVAMISAGDSHTCALLANSSVKCWGWSGAGALGVPDPVGDTAGEVATMAAVDLGAGRTATAISAGSAHTCAVLDSGAVKCWGDNTYGQLGIGTTENMGDDADEMGDALPSVDLGAGRTATAIAAGGDFTCATLDNGAVKCWGYNAQGQLGQGTTDPLGDEPGEMGDALAPIALGAGRTVTALATGADHACATFTDGAVRCWGRNIYGNLGIGDAFDRGGDPVDMAALPDVTLPNGARAAGVTAGDSFTCVVLATGRVTCFGAGAEGQIGNGDDVNIGDQPDEDGDDLVLVDLGPGAGGLVGPVDPPAPPPAALDAAGRFVPLEPVRLFDTRAGETAPGPKGLVGPDASVAVQIAGVGGVPADAIAVVMNLVVTNTTSPGFVTAYPTGADRPAASSINIGAGGQTRPNLVTVPLGTGGTVSLYSLAAVDLIGDVAGYFVDQDVAVAPGRFVAVTPQRLVDTRAAEPGPGPKGKLAAGVSIDVDVLGVGDIPATGVAAIVVNLTGTDSDAPGFLTAYPAGGPVPGTSTVNLSAAGTTAPNLAIVPLGTAGTISIYSSHGAHALADVTGYITDATAVAVDRGLFVPFAPERVFDTRADQTPAGPKGYVAAGASITTQFGGTGNVPAAVGGVVVNVTGIDSPPGFVTVWPTGQARPQASTLNFVEVPADTRANGAWLPVGTGGRLDLFTLTSSHLLADVSGYFLA